ncbi:MAG: VTT domain-containing protein, partial [Syntrophales bacterium]|nr:VTT domain-containing protein [Syntrophales bacterium]
MESKAVNSDPVTAGVMEVKDDITAELTEYLGVGASMANRREYLIFLAASLLVSLGILSLLGYIYLWPLMEPYYALISDKEKISGLFRAAGNWAPIIYILLEVAQVLTMFWPVPLEIAGGFLFGLPLGLVYSMIGLTTGGVLAFLLGRWLERTYLRRMIDPEKLQSFRKVMKREGALAAFIIYLIPGVPKDFVS